MTYLSLPIYHSIFVMAMFVTTYGFHQFVATIQAVIFTLCDYLHNYLPFPSVKYNLLPFYSLPQHTLPFHTAKHTLLQKFNGLMGYTLRELSSVCIVSPLNLTISGLGHKINTIKTILIYQKYSIHGYIKFLYHQH